ncbi:DUF5954 family protein [Micromonospora sp. NPDC049275]|uniref:DUF5954 family protein n=1 Tax=unclassified Micromonospora TaxID=2617518 RepID=UPI0033A7ADCC
MKPRCSGARFRVTRIEAFLRFSPGGPERQRPSGRDPVAPQRPRSTDCYSRETRKPTDVSPP